jgi:hypothetical protein
MPIRTKSTGRPYVFVQATVSTALSSGLTVHLYESECWDSSDPIVLERPDLFADDPPKLHRSTPDPASKPAL